MLLRLKPGIELDPPLLKSFNFVIQGHFLDLGLVSGQHVILFVAHLNLAEVGVGHDLATNLVELGELHAGKLEIEAEAF